MVAIKHGGVNTVKQVRDTAHEKVNTTTNTKEILVRFSGIMKNELWSKIHPSVKV